MTGRQILRAPKADSQIRWAIRFASAPDVSTLAAAKQDALWRQAGKWISLPPSPIDSMGFSIEGPDGVVDAVKTWVREAHLPALIQAQRIARELLQQTARHEPIRLTMRGIDVIIDGPTVGFRAGPLEASFTMTLAWLLSSTPAGQRVRACPECGRLFLRVRRQKYCRDKCTDRALWRAYPESKKRRARQRQYEKQGWIVGARSRKKRDPR